MNKTKRKGSDSSDESKRKRRMVDEVEDDDVYNDKTIFSEMLNKAGFVLHSGNNNNEIGVDQAVFQRSLNLALKRHNSYPDVLEEFLQGFEDYAENGARFHKSLMPTLTSSECDSARSSTQNSLVRILLGIDAIQPKLVTLLLEKLPEFGDEDYIFEQGDKVFLPRVLLSQFRWLDRIVSCKDLAVKLLEIIEITSFDVQREIIACLPEIVEDTEHGVVAKTLRDILLQGNQLTVPILDALSNLALSTDLLTEVRGSVMQTLNSVEMKDLPVVIKFLLQTATSQDALEVVGEIRANLSFKSSRAQKTSRPGSETDVSKDDEALTLDAIKSGIRFQKSIAEAWIKVIDSLTTPADHKIIDIFVLLILHSTNRQKPVESLFRNKIRIGAFTEVLLQSAFHFHSQIIREYFPSILSIAEVLLRSPEVGIVYFACAMYKEAFHTFDTFCQQEIVGNLVTHIGSGFQSEIDSSLDILVDLVNNQQASMARFSIFLKGILDYLDNLSVMQIRKLYGMLSRLAFHNPEEGGLIQDDLHMVIRKQLSSDNPKYKKMGVIAAIMVAKSIAFTGKQSETSLSADLYKQVISLLQLVRTSSSRMPVAAALFMDELSAVVCLGQQNSEVETWIADNMIADFQDDYVVDVEEDKLTSTTDVPLAVLYGLNDECESTIAIDLLPLVIKTRTNHNTHTDVNRKIPDPICLCSHFRLVQMCERHQQNGNLEGIDALLGCPLYAVRKDVFGKFECLSDKEKEIICCALFHNLNWFREIVNCFATQTDPEMKGKVILRLQNITDMQKTLVKCLAATPLFQPPPANFDLEDQTVTVSSDTGEVKKKNKKTGKKKGKGKGEKENVDDSDEASRDSTQMDADKSSAKDTQSTLKSDNKEKTCISLANYRQYFRELDISVFTILNTGLISRAALDTELNTKAVTSLQIHPSQLEFLLDDLAQKLNHSLLASSSKRRTFFKVKGNKNVGFHHLDQFSAKEIASKAVQLLPALCNHLEGTSAFFQTMINDNDGLIDGPGYDSEEAVLMTSCFQLLLQSVMTLFSWNGFLVTDNQPLLKEALGVLVGRIKSLGSTQVLFQELVSIAFQYIENFAATVPNISTAVILIKLLTALAAKLKIHKLSGKLGNLAETFLKREWMGADGEKEKGAKHNDSLQTIIKTYLTYSDDPLIAAETITTKGIPELIESDKKGCSTTFASLNRSSFPVFYRVVFTEMVTYIKSLPPGKNSDSRETKVDLLIRWNIAVRILHILVNLIKTFDGRSIVGVALKNGRQFVDVFLRNGMPLLDKMFRTNREEVQSLLKNFQLSTRAMHHLSSHSKIIRDVCLTNQVPLLKRALEQFVYRVKAMLTVNNCLEAFWMGNLKNRDLQGEEILSQVSVVTEVGDQSDNEGVEQEDDESEVEMDNQSEAGQEKPDESDDQSCSDVF